MPALLHMAQTFPGVGHPWHSLAPRFDTHLGPQAFWCCGSRPLALESPSWQVGRGLLLDACRACQCSNFYTFLNHTNVKNRDESCARPERLAG